MSSLLCYLLISFLKTTNTPSGSTSSTCAASSVQTHHLIILHRGWCVSSGGLKLVYKVYIKLKVDFPWYSAEVHRAEAFLERLLTAAQLPPQSPELFCTVQTATVQERRPAADLNSWIYFLTFQNKFVITPSILFICASCRERILMTWRQTTGRGIKFYCSCCYKILHFAHLKKIKWNLQQNKCAAILTSPSEQEYLKFLLSLLLKRLYGTLEGTWTQERNAKGNVYVLRHLVNNHLRCHIMAHLQRIFSVKRVKHSHGTVTFTKEWKLGLNLLYLFAKLLKQLLAQLKTAHFVRLFTHGGL